MGGFASLIFGLIIGSFLNVCIYRMPIGESIAFPPSHCTCCRKRIKWYDLIPVMSYFVLKGRCRYCGERISRRYPGIELMTGIIFFALYIKYGSTIYFLKYTVLSAFLIVIGFIDYDTTDVYLKNTLPAVIVGVFFVLLSYINGQNVITFLYGAALSYGVIAALIIITRGMGWGDAEICLLCGIYLGFKLSAVMLFLSFISGGIAGAILVLLKKKTLKNIMAFGPFIAGSAIFTTLFGDKLLTFYIERLFSVSLISTIFLA